MKDKDIDEIIEDTAEATGQVLGAVVKAPFKVVEGFWNTLFGDDDEW